MKKIYSHFIFCVFANLHVNVPCKKIHLILHVNKKLNIMKSYLVLGACPIQVWAGDPWGQLGVVPLLVVVGLSSSEINEMNVTVQKINPKINQYIPQAPEVWILLLPPPKPPFLNFFSWDHFFKMCESINQIWVDKQKIHTLSRNYSNNNNKSETGIHRLQSSPKRGSPL